MQSYASKSDHRPVDLIDLANRGAVAGVCAIAAALSVLTVHLVLRLPPGAFGGSSAHEALGAGLQALSRIGAGGQAAVFAAAALTLAAVVVVLATLHEAVHGAVFWAFTRRRPDFGFDRHFVFCGLPPGTFLSRNRYLVALLAPLAVVTLLGVAVIALVPLLPSLMIALGLVMHAASAAGDVWVALKLVRRPAEDQVWDTGVSMIVYSAA